MASAATKLMTAEEFYDWVHRPENQDKEYELVRGEVVGMTKPGRRHGFVCVNIVWILSNYTRQQKKGYVCSNDTGMIVERDPDTVRGPDISLYDDANTYEEIDIKYGETPALLVVEVLSPHDSMGKMMERITDQLRFGTRLLWLVDPEARNVTVYRPKKEPYVVKENGELTGDDVLPDFRCKVAEFFAMPGQ
jgi:Uma2 family endonuclease